MATVSGFVLDLGLSAIPGLRLKFIASSPASWVNSLYVTKPIIVYPGSDGAFAVDLRTTENVTPTFTYSCRAEWPDPNFFAPDQGMAGMDIFEGMSVPKDGGLVGDLVTLPPSSMAVWVGPTNNLAYGFWFDPTTNNLWSN